MMKFINEYLEKVIKIKPLGELSTEVYESECGSYTGEELLIDGKRTGIIIYYIDYLQWLEKQLIVRKIHL